MKKSYIVIWIFIALAVGGAIGYGVYKNMNPADFGRGTNSRFNSIDVLISAQVTTTALPVKVLDKDADRRYAIITNISGTTIYLFATTTVLTIDGLEPGEGEKTATTSITVLNGIPVLANGSYVIDPDNTLYGHIWASSTASGLNINVSYK